MSKTVGMTPGPVKVQEFKPSNTGTEGQVLIKTENGYEWGDVAGASNYHRPEAQDTVGDASTPSSITAEVVAGENNSNSGGSSYEPIFYN
jgi:hypothetical protein